MLFSLYSKTHPRGIKRLFAQNETFAKKFSEQISVPIFTNDELVTFARSYSRELGYKIDDMAVLALYNRISNIQRLDQATTLTRGGKTLWMKQFIGRHGKG